MDNSLDIASNLQVKIITPTSVLVESVATLVTMPGENGQFGVMPNHAKLIANLVTGIVLIQHNDTKIGSYFIDTALANIEAKQVEIIAEYAVDLNDNSQQAIVKARIADYNKILSNIVDIDYSQWLTAKIQRDELLLKYLYSSI